MVRLSASSTTTSATPTEPRSGHLADILMPVSFDPQVLLSKEGDERRMVLYKESARKHGYNEQDIERVLDHPITTTEGTARDGSLMVVKTGFASNAGLYRSVLSIPSP